MNSSRKHARWSVTLATAASLLLTTGGLATADDAPAAGDGVVALTGIAQGVVISPDGSKAYVQADAADGSASHLDVVDTASATLTADVTLTGGAHNYQDQLAVSPDGTRVYVLAGTTLDVVDTATNTLRTSITVPDAPTPAGTTPGRPTRVTVSVDGSAVYVGQYGANGPAPTNGRILVYSVARNSFVSAVPLPGPGAYEIALKPGSTDAYAGSSGGLVHLKANGTSLTAVGTIAPPGMWDIDLAVSPDGARLYSSGFLTNKLTVTDTASDTVRTAFDAVPDPGYLDRVLAGPDGTRIYALKREINGSDAVVSIDATTNAPVPAEDLTEFAVDSVQDIALSRDGRTLLVLGSAAGTFSYSLQIVNR